MSTHYMRLHSIEIDVTFQNMESAQQRQLVTRWRKLTAEYNGAACALDRALHDAHGIGMSEFETLDRLAESDHGKFRMQQLAEDMYLSQSALSRLVARMERSGYVERAMCDADRRALFVRLTDAGRARHTAARETHRAVLSERLVDETPAVDEARESLNPGRA